MSRFDTPESRAAYNLGMTLEEYASLGDRETFHAADVEETLTNENPENPRFLSEADLISEVWHPEDDEMTMEQIEWMRDDWYENHPLD